MIVKMYVKRVKALVTNGMALEDALLTVPMLWRSAVAAKITEEQNG